MDIDDGVQTEMARNEKPFDPMRDIAEFHVKFGLEYSGKPRAIAHDLEQFRHAFLVEEVEEWANNQQLARDEASVAPKYRSQETIAKHLEEAFDALIDLMYVTLGTAYLHGFAPMFKEGWRRVHAANMAKVRAERLEDSRRGSIKYDVIKPPGWKPPDHLDLITDHAHRDPTD